MLCAAHFSLAHLATSLPPTPPSICSPSKPQAQPEVAFATSRNNQRHFNCCFVLCRWSNSSSSNHRVKHRQQQQPQQQQQQWRNNNNKNSNGTVITLRKKKNMFSRQLVSLAAFWPYLAESSFKSNFHCRGGGSVEACGKQEEGGERGGGCKSCGNYKSNAAERCRPVYIVELAPHRRQHPAPPSHTTTFRATLPPTLLSLPPPVQRECFQIHIN